MSALQFTWGSFQTLKVKPVLSPFNAIIYNVTILKQ